MRSDYSHAYNSIKAQIETLKAIAHAELDRLEDEEKRNAEAIAEKMTSGKIYCADNFIMQNGSHVHRFITAIESLDDGLNATLTHCNDLDVMAND